VRFSRSPADVAASSPEDLTAPHNIFASISSAMIATLPVIDASDPPKSLAVFRLVLNSDRRALARPDAPLPF